MWCTQRNTCESLLCNYQYMIVYWFIWCYNRPVTQKVFWGFLVPSLQAISTLPESSLWLATYSQTLNPWWQEKNISSLLVIVLLYSSIFPYFLPHFGPPGGWLSHEKALTMPLPLVFKELLKHQSNCMTSLVFSVHKCCMKFMILFLHNYILYRRWPSCSFCRAEKIWAPWSKCKYWIKELFHKCT